MSPSAASRSSDRSPAAGLPALERAIDALYEYRQLFPRRAPSLAISGDGWDPVPLADLIEALEQRETRTAAESDAHEPLVTTIDALRDVIAATAPEMPMLDLELGDDGESASIDETIAALSRLLNSLRSAPVSST